MHERVVEAEHFGIAWSLTFNVAPICGGHALGSAMVTGIRPMKRGSFINLLFSSFFYIFLFVFESFQVATVSGPGPAAAPIALALD